MRIFVDQDGVLANCNQDDFTCDPPLYKLPGYFRGLKPDKKMINLMKKLYALKLSGNDKYFNIDRLYVLTTVEGDGGYLRRCKIDKLHWFHNYICKDQGINKNYYMKFVTGGKNKPERAEEILGRKLQKDDILIDDYNGNLKAWENAGGTGVKYINGQNHINSWDGYHMRQSLNMWDKLHLLNKICEDVKEVE